MSKSKEKASLEKRFDFHIRSILPSDSSGEEDNSGKAMKQLPKCSKRETDSKLRRDSDNNTKKNDYPNLNELFEGLEREIMHKTEVNKNIITKVIVEVLIVYKRNFRELLCKQKKEMVNLKKKFVDNMHRELEHWEKYMNSVKQQEEKLMTVLDQLKDLYKSSPFRMQKVEMVIEMHKDFLQVIVNNTVMIISLYHCSLRIYFRNMKN